MPLVCYRIFSVVGGVLSQHNTSICTCTAFFEYLAHEIGHGTKLLNTGQKGIIMNQQLIKIPSWHCQFSSPRAESARVVTGRRNSHRWEGGRLFEPSAGFFYGNSCNSGSESRKIAPRVEKTVSTRATNGPLTKIGVVWQKSDFWAKKNTHFLRDTMFWLWPGNVEQTKKYPFPKKKSVF